MNSSGQISIISGNKNPSKTTMSYNDIQMYHQAATNRQNLASYGAFRQPQQQQVQMPYHGQQQLHSFHPYTPTGSSNTSQHYAKGKKPSLAAFDPFSSSSTVDASPMGRDSSPTSPDRTDQQRQPVTPPSTGRPIATTTPNPTSTNYSKLERFDNEKTSKNPVSKTVNKILRKAALVKNLSLGHHSPNNSGHKRTSNGSSSTNNTRGKSSSKPAAKSVVLPKADLPTTGKENKVNTASLVSKNAQPSSPVRDSLEKSDTTMAQDLMELKDQFGKLEMPSLMAKTAPTSFLTGTGDEAVTTNCSNEPTPFQLEIPSLSEVVTMARLNEFVENYRRYDQNLDLKQFVGLDKNELQHKIDSSNPNNKSASTSSGMVQEHVPIVQSLLDCREGHEQDISVQGFVTEPGNLHSDSRVEAVIFQGQRNFTVIFRGTTEQQSKVLGNSKSKKRAVQLDSNNQAAEVYSGFLESYLKMEDKCFRTIDKLVDENPFCDFVFSGYSFGAALATLAAFRYAKARPMMRIGCLTLASPKVGFSHFRHVVNTTPNLKVVRLELGGQTETKCLGPTVGGWHVGHTLVLNAQNSGSSSPRSGSPTNGVPSSPETNNPSVSVFKFDGAPKHKNGGFFKTSNPGLKKYISALEELATLQNNRIKAVAASKGKHKLASPWPKDFANNTGEGVIINNEKRLVV